MKPDVRLRYIAPECDLGFERSNITERSDVYAFAMVILTLTTLKPPFTDKKDWRVAESARAGERPPRPIEMGQLGMRVAQRLWELVTAMWNQDAFARPTMPDVEMTLSSLFAKSSNTDSILSESEEATASPTTPELFPYRDSMFAQRSRSEAVSAPRPRPDERLSGIDDSDGYAIFKLGRILHRSLAETKRRWAGDSRTLSSICSSHSPIPLHFDRLYDVLRTPEPDWMNLYNNRVMTVECAHYVWFGVSPSAVCSRDGFSYRLAMIE